MTHRRVCNEPAPMRTPSRAEPGLDILRCRTCDAVELRRHDEEQIDEIPPHRSPKGPRLAPPEGPQGTTPSPHRGRTPCEWCGEPMYTSQKLEADHVIPRSLGGTEATRLLHQTCNRKKGDTTGGLKRWAL